MVNPRRLSSPDAFDILAQRLGIRQFWTHCVAQLELA